MSKTQLTYTLTQKLTYKLTQKDLSLKDHESPNQPQQKMSFLSPKKGRWRFFLGPTWLPGYPADQTAPNLGTPSRRRKRRPVPLTAHPAPHGVKRWSRHVGWPPLRLESGEDGRDGEKGESFRGAFSLAVLGGVVSGGSVGGGVYLGRFLAIAWVIYLFLHDEDVKKTDIPDIHLFKSISHSIERRLSPLGIWVEADSSLWGRFPFWLDSFFKLEPPPSISTLVFFKKNSPTSPYGSHGRWSERSLVSWLIYNQSTGRNQLIYIGVIIYCIHLPSTSRTSQYIIIFSLCRFKYSWKT